MTLETSLRENILKLAMKMEADVASPYAIDGNPPMWDIMLEADGRMMAVRPARAQVRVGHLYQECDGVAVGWHRDGVWTADQHMKMDIPHFAEKVFLPALGGGGTLQPEVELAIDDELRRRAEIAHLERCGNVQASAHSDDRVKEISFDARPFLARAGEDELLGLREIDWRGDYAADAVYHAACAAGDYDAMKLEAYLAGGPTMPDGDTVGFEVVCDETDMLAWLRAHRPEMHAAVMAAEFRSIYEIGEGDLDDLVHDVASKRASDVNNQGGGDDEAVHDDFSRNASDVNNEGVDGQLRFLFAEGLSMDEVAAALDDVKAAP